MNHLSYVLELEWPNKLKTFKLKSDTQEIEIEGVDLLLSNWANIDRAISYNCKYLILEHLKNEDILELEKKILHTKYKDLKINSLFEVLLIREQI